MKKRLKLAEFVYSNYTKGTLPRFEIELGFAERAVEAILDGSLDLLHKPLVFSLYSGEYTYDGETVARFCAETGLVDFVCKMIDATDQLRNEQMESMLSEITQDAELRDKLRIRIAAAIELCNPRFLYGSLGMIRSEQLQEMLKKSGIEAYIRMCLEN